MEKECKHENGRFDSPESFSSHIQAQGYKTFFMLNSAEHEILNAVKYKNI